MIYLAGILADLGNVCEVASTHLIGTALDQSEPKHHMLGCLHPSNAAVSAASVTANG